MLSKVLTGAVIGLDGAVVEVEVDIASGNAHFVVVGLPDAAVQESKERVRAAIRNSGCTFPYKRIAVSLAPAELKKEGASYDLPIAVAILEASGQLVLTNRDQLFLGELALDGALRPTSGILSIVALAKEKGVAEVYVPAINAAEAALIGGVRIMPVKNLTQLVTHLRGEGDIGLYSNEGKEVEYKGILYTGTDLADIKGQEHAKRALEISASGSHNVLFIGPPGTGKTLLARALPSILPEMTTEESLEVTRIYSVAGLLPPETPLITQRPFRAPHHTISSAGLVGGGRVPRPGEITLSHRGVLFLDELPEFGMSVLELMRQPLEDKVITISRAQGSMTYLANFTLVAAMNPCPCGFFTDPVKQCSCSRTMVARYQKRISGPLLDRVDMFVDVPRVEYDKLTDDRFGESSDHVRERIERVREVQRRRFADSNVACNGEMMPSDVRVHCQLDDIGQALLKTAMNQMHLSARAFHRTLKLARTIGDFAGSDGIEVEHLAEALQYRPKGFV